jgi:uncharacterized protein
MAAGLEPTAAALRRVVEDVAGVVSVYLFGSVAAGRAHRQSDVDVAVLLDPAAYPSPAARFEVRLDLTAVAVSALRRNDVDVLILNDTPPHLARDIVTRGLRVHVADGEAEHAFRRTTMLRPRTWTRSSAGGAGSRSRG